MLKNMHIKGTVCVENTQELMATMQIVNRMNKK